MLLHAGEQHLRYAPQFVATASCGDLDVDELVVCHIVLRILHRHYDIADDFENTFPGRKALEHLRQQDGVVRYEACTHMFAQPGEVQICERAKTLHDLPIDCPSRERQVPGDLPTHIGLPEGAAETGEYFRRSRQSAEIIIRWWQGPAGQRELLELMYVFPQATVFAGRGTF